MDEGTAMSESPRSRNGSDSLVAKIKDENSSTSNLQKDTNPEVAARNGGDFDSSNGNSTVIGNSGTGGGGLGTTNDSAATPGSTCNDNNTNGHNNNNVNNNSQDNNQARSIANTTETVHDEEEELPYPGFVPKSFYCLKQTNKLRWMCLKIITWPYPF